MWTRPWRVQLFACVRASVRVRWTVICECGVRASARWLACLCWKLKRCLQLNFRITLSSFNEVVRTWMCVCVFGYRRVRHAWTLFSECRIPSPERTPFVFDCRLVYIFVKSFCAASLVGLQIPRTVVLRGPFFGIFGGVVKVSIPTPYTHHLFAPAQTCTP